jgi:hypothetical protein
MCIRVMHRINLTVNDDNFKFLKQMKDSGMAASISHAARIAIQEYRKSLMKEKRIGKRLRQKEKIKGNE